MVTFLQIFRTRVFRHPVRCVALFACLLALSGAALSAVRVLALFPGKAMLEVDGQRKVLAVGQRFAGVQLIEANPREARVRLHGRIERLRPGGAVGTHYAAPRHREMRLLSQGGSFFADGLINGQPVRMLVDTGADTVAMSEARARLLGIRYKQGRPVVARTASGTSRAYGVTLDSLKLGGQTFHGVRAIVIEGGGPPSVLLGMNILSRFDIDHRQNLMILRAK
jgi:aspartyl protease family protein